MKNTLQIFLKCIRFLPPSQTFLLTYFPSPAISRPLTAAWEQDASGRQIHQLPLDFLPSTLVSWMLAFMCQHPNMDLITSAKTQIWLHQLGPTHCTAPRPQHYLSSAAFLGFRIVLPRVTFQGSEYCLQDYPHKTSFCCLRNHLNTKNLTHMTLKRLLICPVFTYRVRHRPFEFPFFVSCNISQTVSQTDLWRQCFELNTSISWEPWTLPRALPAVIPPKKNIPSSSHSHYTVLTLHFL